MRNDMLEKKIQRALSKIKKLEDFQKVKFIILYGSGANHTMRRTSDIDLCIYYDGPSDEASKFRVKVLSELFDDIYDVHIFNQLPLYIQKEVLKGRVLYSSDQQFLYDVAARVIKKFDDFKHRYYDYIGEKKIS